jgi:multidrug efflux system membrane fusion protein
MRWRNRLVTVAGAGLGLTALIVAGAMLRRPAADAPAQERPDTTTVTRQTLVDVTTVDGTLAYGPEQLIESRIAGTVTALPAVGATLDRGRVLFRIDDKPVVLLIGTLPAYRALTAGHAAVANADAGGAGPGTDPGAGGGPGGGSGAAVPATKGADVKEFETNLKALGYSGFTVDEQYSQQTAAAVRRWQKDLGLPQTGVVELGRVLYVPGPLRVTKLKASLGAVTNGPVLSYTSTVRLVTANVPEHDQALAKVGTRVTVALPTGTEVPGRVQSVRTPDSDQTAADQEPALDVVVGLDDPAAVRDLDDGPARVRFVAQQRRDVLVVPVGALLALAEGGYGLEVIEGGGSRIVAVTTGLFADGKVEVSGPDIREATTVGMAK